MTEAKDLFIKNFNKALKLLGIENYSDEKFIIILTNKTEKYNNLDDIYRIWSTPLITGIRLSYKEVIEGLVKKEQNTIPLWIKISKEQNKPIQLKISQRFRKVKQLLMRNPNNEISPFELENNSVIEFSLEQERLEAIKILFFSRRINQRLIKIIGKEISYQEYKNNFTKHFKKYRFYPPLPNHQKESDNSYSKLVIDKNFEKENYSICLATEMENDLSLDQVLHYYADKELNWKFCDIEIKKEH